MASMRSAFSRSLPWRVQYALQGRIGMDAEDGVRHTQLHHAGEAEQRDMTDPRSQSPLF